MHFLNRKIEKMMNGFLWSMNTSQAREQIRIKLNKILDAELTDDTTPEGVDSGIMTFCGYLPKRKKVINIIINTRS
jgi:hypothetical protein